MLLAKLWSIALRKRGSLVLKKCPVCKTTCTAPVFEAANIPLYCLHYFDSRKDALAAERRSVDFVQCQICGFVFNQQYEQLNYQVEYEAGRSTSPTFKDNLLQVASLLLDNISEEIETVVEVGAGDGDFSQALKSLDPSPQYFAYDPSENLGSKVDGITFYQRYYHDSEKLLPTLVIARHVLEHQSNVHQFMQSVLHECPKYCFIEIPCSSFVLKENFHYFSYEHCSYFDLSSLIKLMSDFHYTLTMSKYMFNDENLITLWKKTNNLTEKTRQIDIKVASVKSVDLRLAYNNWRSELLQKICDRGSIIWGVAGKGVMLLNMLNLDYKLMPQIIDINPLINNKYIPIMGNQIVSPSELGNTKPEKIFVSNSIYRDEITYQVRQMGLASSVEPLFDLE